MKKIKHSAFSLIELTISMIIIAVIMAVLTPIISKKLSSSSVLKNKILTDCESFYPDGFCAMCYIAPKSCIVCTKNCNTNEYKRVNSCICEKCAEKYNDFHCSKCNSKNCTQCDKGYYLNENHKCTLCPLGHYCYQTSQGSIKAPCEVGSAASSLGMDSCDKCKQSSPSTQGSFAASTGMMQCSVCNNGYYASKQGQTTPCQKCPSGFYCPQGKLIPCEMGTANNLEGQSECKKCAQSTVSSTGSVAINAGMKFCANCADGTYASVAGQSFICIACPEGFYCPQGKLIPCEMGTANALKGQASCMNCNKSSSSISGNVATSQGQRTCTPCAAGTFASDDRQTTPCKPCPLGMACSNGTIVQCGAGYYSNGNALTCAPCPSGSTSNAGAVFCETCATGCALCSSSPSNCTSCKQGYYKNLNSCLTCPSGYYCPGGTSAKIPCTKWHQQCKSCSATGCSACNDKYEVDGTGCKLSFDCIKEGGKEVGNICYKEITYNFYTPKSSTVKIIASEVCGSGWNLPSYLDLCILQIDGGINAILRDSADHFYTSHFHALKCTVGLTPTKNSCKFYVRNDTILKSSPRPGCNIALYQVSRSSNYCNTNVGCVHYMQ